MRVLIASVVRQEPDVLAAHLRCLKGQRLRGRVYPDLLYLVDADGEHVTETREMLADAGAEVWMTGPRPEGAAYAVSSQTHHWAEPTFHFLGREKDRILDHARERCYDAVLLVDSDLLLGAETLQSLLDADKPVCSAVFWTAWQPGEQPLPQVWQRHPYGFDGGGWSAPGFLAALGGCGLVRVRGLGACTLIRREALVRGVSFAPVEGLPSGGMWQGEDRHFCVRAERLHVELWADAWPRVWHCYRPEDRTEIPARAEELLAMPEGAPLPGDLVSLRLESLDVPRLHAHGEFLRGRLGTLPTPREVERAVADLTPGRAAFVPLRFPADWPVRAGEETTLRVTLLGVRSSAA